MNLKGILTLQRLVILLTGTLLLLCIGVNSAIAQVSILVNTGHFTDVEDAANGEEMVNWGDADLSDDRACTESFAALELSHFLTLCTVLSKNDIRFVSVDNLPGKGDVFLLGSRQSSSLISSLDPSGDDSLKTEQSFHIRAFQDNNRTITIIEGKDRIGTLYGVYAYLERLGIRFYGLGEKGTVYPVNPSSLPQALNITVNPSFLNRGFDALGDRGGKDIFYWMARNRMNFCNDTGNETPFRKKLGMVLARGRHDFQAEFLSSKSEYPYNYLKFKGDENKSKDPYAESDEYIGDTNGDGKLSYFEAHPEWFGLRNGKRSDRNYIIYQGDNYNTSNKDATKELAKNLVQSLIDGDWRNVDIVNSWMLDNGNWCECENCKRQGNYTDRLLYVDYVILKEIQKAHKAGVLPRKVMLVTLAYHETLPAPSHPLPEDFDYKDFSVKYFPAERCYVHALADPACTEINQFLLRDYQEWAMRPGRNYKGSITVGEYYNVSALKSLPMLFPTIMATDIPWYYQSGSRRFTYMHTPVHSWGTWTLNQYLFARLLWNTKTDADDLLSEYFRLYYPTTSEHTKKFYHYLEKATANIKPFKQYAGKNRYLVTRHLTNDSVKIFTLDHLQYDSHHPLINDGPSITDMVNYMGLARKEIDASLMQCRDRTEQARLIEDDQRFEYGEEMILFYYHLIRTAIFYRQADELAGKNEFHYVEKYANQLRNIVDLLSPLANHPGGGVNAKNGFEAASVTDTYNFFKARYGN